jgi:hypothetical protein
VLWSGYNKFLPFLSERRSVHGFWEIIRLSTRSPFMDSFRLVDDSGVMQSELRPDNLEYPCNMRVNFSLLRDSDDEGANPWDVVPVVLQFIDAMDRLMMYLAGSHDPARPACKCGRSCGVFRNGTGLRTGRRVPSPKADHRIQFGI